MYWTLENAAAAIARQECWHEGAQESFLTAMELAANQGDLVVRDPHTDLRVRKNKVHRFYETLKVSDVNAWLQKQDAPYRWREASEPPPSQAPKKGGERRWTDEFKAEVRAYREKHGLSKTAKQYAVSQATISKHVPAGKPKKPALGVWGGLTSGKK